MIRGDKVNFRMPHAEWKTMARKVAEVGVTAARKKLSEKRHPPASQPGTVPARRTGFLAGSFKAENTREGARVRTTADYARYLEQGTSKMEARPFIGAVMQENAKRARKLDFSKLVSAR